MNLTADDKSTYDKEAKHSLLYTWYGSYLKWYTHAYTV